MQALRRLFLGPERPAPPPPRIDEDAFGLHVTVAELLRGVRYGDMPPPNEDLRMAGMLTGMRDAGMAAGDEWHRRAGQLAPLVDEQLQHLSAGVPRATLERVWATARALRRQSSS